MCNTRLAKNIYFLGIGGVGMSGLAGWCYANQYNVSGYDRNDNYFTLKLKNSGILIQHDVSTSKLPKDFLNNENTLIIYTPAIKKDHPLYMFFHDSNYTIIKRSELLRRISADYKVIAIAGTHGKTTVSIMLSHLLKNAGFSPSAFFGGISLNYDTNFLIGSSEYMIVEADEYDQSFLKLSPDISLITSIDRDHVDTYVSEEDMLQSYYHFYINTVDRLFISHDVASKFYTHCKKFGNKSGTIIVLDEVEYGNHYETSFTHMCEHNVKNAIMASVIAEFIGLTKTQITKGFESYIGVKRRFEYHVDLEHLILIDDYAHHPEELKVLINSIRKLYLNHELFLIFQPHLFSRTQDLENEFCDVLSSVDKLALLDIYPAREKPIPGVNSKNMLAKVNLDNKWYVNANNLIGVLQTEKPNLIVTAGAGDVYKLVPMIKSILE